MKFTIWFLCIVFPIMFVFFGDLVGAGVATMFLYGVGSSIRWLFAKAQEAKMKREAEARVIKLR
jgi:hypothetical protein